MLIEVSLIYRDYLLLFFVKCLGSLEVLSVMKVPYLGIGNGARFYFLLILGYLSQSVFAGL